MKKNANFEIFKRHFLDEISEKIRDYVTNNLLLKSRYLFTKRVAGIQYSYCTHCRNTYRTDILKHNDEITCLKCDSKCKVKASGISRKSLIDGAYFVYYEKSVINPLAIIARGFHVRRDYRGDFKDIETKYTLSSMYVFEVGKSQMYYTSGWSDIGWVEANNVRSEFANYRNWVPTYCNFDSIKEAIKDTPFKYSTWEKYLQADDRDMVKFFDLAARYPCIEYLTKLDFSYFVSAKLIGRKTYGAINWNGTHIEKILKLNKQDLRELKKSNIEIKPLTLRLFQITRKDTNRLSLEELHTFVEMTKDCFEELKNFFKYAKKISGIGMTDVINYLKRQYNRKSKKKRYTGIGDTIITWRDYLIDCMKLEMDLLQEDVLFPIDLFAAHQRTNVLVDVKVNSVHNEKIIERCKKLGKYIFELNGMVIRPATSCLELINEGKSLKICIGGYAERYAEGKTDLFLIRKLDDIETPYFAMEVSGDRIIQTQGRGHCSPTKEVQAFIDAFKVEKLTKKQIEIKVAV